MSTVFTDSQKKAHDIWRHLSVTANAGSGKTTVLVHRYVDILTTTDAHVGEVVAITFTDKAAGELKHKIAEVVADRLRLADDPAMRARLEHIRNRLSSAVIGTIHSFCARILREHPVEAGVDAAFTVLEAIDQRALVRHAILETFQRSLLRGDPDHRKTAVDLLRAVGKQKLPGLIEFIVSKRDVLKHLRSPSGLYSQADEEINRIWTESLNRFARGSVTSLEFTQSISQILQHAPAHIQKTAAAFLKELERAQDYIKIAQTVDSLAGLILTGRGKFRRDFSKEEVSDRSLLAASRTLFQVRQSLSTFGELQDVKRSDEAHLQLLALTRRLFILFDLVSERFEEMKREQSALDFDDLLIRTGALLEMEDVRSSLTKRFKYLMVDEYQDTNKLQYDILRKLVNGFKDGNLFIVGDPKQSIYGFRNAEVEVFQQTKEEITRSNDRTNPFWWKGERMRTREEELRGAVTLPDSFRLLRDVVAFVNVVFEPLMKRNDQPHEVEYEPLVLARDNSANGGVELLIHPVSSDHDETSEQPDNAVAAECALIARRIHALVRDRFSVFENRNEQSRPIRYQDIAILLRSRTNLPELEKALLSHSIPYLIHGGVGFYQTQEIYDLYNYLEFLLNVENDAALAGVLRSPFFAIADSELFEISLVDPPSAGPETFWSKLRNYASEASATPELLRVHKILASHLHIAQRLTPFDLLKRIIDDTAWVGAISGTNRKEQHKANVEKLLTFARDFSERGFVGLFDFTERFKNLIESHENEGQANIDTGGNSVRILTIHAAKGLEFPVVILPFTHRSFRNDPAPFLDAELGLGIRPGEDQEQETRAIFPITEYLKQLSRSKTVAEEKRIFYVACTRARDLFILSGDEANMRLGPSYLRWVYEALDIESIGSLSEIERDVGISTLEKKESGYASLTLRHRLTIRVVSTDEPSLESVEPPNESERTLPDWRLEIAPLPARQRGEMYTASQMQTFFDCPTKFYLIYRLGVPEGFRLAMGDSDTLRPSGEEDSVEMMDQLSPSLQGTIVHRVLEQCRMPMSMPEVKDVVETELKRMGQYNESTFREVAQRITSLIGEFLESKSAKLVFAPKQFETEYAVQAVLGNHYISGTIDRLVKQEDGSWAIVDYKTDAIDRDFIADHRERYNRQMQMYAFLVQRLHPEQEEVICTLLFLRAPDLPQVITYSVKQLEEFEEELTNAISQIEEMDNRAFSVLPRATSHCPRCGFFSEERCLLFKHEAA